MMNSCNTSRFIFLSFVLLTTPMSSAHATSALPICSIDMANRCRLLPPVLVLDQLVEHTRKDVVRAAAFREQESADAAEDRHLTLLHAGENQIASLAVVSPPPYVSRPRSHCSTCHPGSS